MAYKYKHDLKTGQPLFDGSKFIATGRKQRSGNSWAWEVRCTCGELIWRRINTKSKKATGCHSCKGIGKNVEQRFLDSFVKGKQDECWEWKGTINKEGYGNISKRINGKEIKILVHRYALERQLGRPLKKNMLVCHKCNNRICVNPKHLYEGTIQDNVRDREISNRTARGSAIPNAILDEKRVAKIKIKLRKNKQTNRAIAKEFNVKENLIAQIKAGNTWAHVN